jgi:hypothetical protein
METLPGNVKYYFNEFEDAILIVSRIQNICFFLKVLKLKVLRLENVVLGTEPKPRQVTKSAIVLNIEPCVSSVASRTMLMWPV